MTTSELDWFKSSYSSSASGDCVEVALTPTTVHVRDSKAPQAARLTLSPATWAGFLTDIAAGRRRLPRP
ncbi:DUF397 domain-containing protein [Streptomyces sp. 7R007]